MHDFRPDLNQPKQQLYGDLTAAAAALIDGEPDPVANMANLAAVIWQYLPDLNWAGFYRVVDSDQVDNEQPGGRELVLGPFIGKPACIRIAWGKGVCGTAAASGQSQCVTDVHAFPGHIACDAASQSELVVPVRRGDAVIAVIDLDSPRLARFDAEDVAGVEALAKAIAAAI